MESSNMTRPPATVRRTDEPPSAGPPWTWINPAGGQSGNNAERYIYDEATDTWALTYATGPDTPLNPAEGAQWRDTANGQQKVYTGTGWVSIGVSDHSQLSGLAPDNHHARPMATAQAEIVGGWAVEITDTGTAQPNRSADGLRVYNDYQYSQDLSVDLTWADGTTVTFGPTTTAAFEYATWNFEARQVAELDQNTGSTTTELHYLTVASHDHTI